MSDGAQPHLQLSTEIQGDVLAGFKKDHAYFLFLEFRDRADARRWLGPLVNRLSFTDRVAAFNNEFRRRRQLNGGVDPPDFRALWRGLSFTMPGVGALSPSLTAIFEANPRVPYMEGAAARAGRVGDTGASDPSNWIVGGPKNRPVHALLTLGADDPDELGRVVADERAYLAEHRIDIAYEESAATLAEGPGGRIRYREHFGFRDGVSQPGVRGFDVPSRDNTHVQGYPSRELIQPGEFVLGFQAEDPPKEDTEVQRRMPLELRFGSFQVVRRLHQDVIAWMTQVGATQRRLSTEDASITENRLLGKLVGRDRGARALHHLLDPNPPAGQPGDAEPPIHFDQDGAGYRTPGFAHIRKMNPGRALPDYRRRRIIRRSIPYGPLFDFQAEVGADRQVAERGLYFIAYMANIWEQFEWIQRRWANTNNVPPRHGVDPIVGLGPAGHELPREGQTSLAFDFARCVRTTGAIYAFVPSRTTLEQLAAET